jgi:3-isopropylmalate dehydrogenase
MDAALKVLTAAGAKEGEEFEYNRALIGGAAIDATGSPLPKETLDLCKSSDAVLLAAIGGCVCQTSTYLLSSAKCHSGNSL